MAEYDAELLTEEERAALEEDDGTEDDAPDTGADEPDADGEDGDEGQDGDEEGEGEAEDEADGDVDGADGDPDAGEEEGAEEEGSDDPAPAEQPAPQAQTIDIQQVDQVLDTYKQNRTALMARYNEGELTDDEFGQEIDSLEDQRADALINKKLHEKMIADEDERWKATSKAYLDQYPTLRDDQDMLMRYDKFVNKVTEDEEYAHMTFEQQLATAHAQFAATGKAMGWDVPDLKEAPAPKDKRTQKAKPSPKDDNPTNEGLGKAPKTLARAPASDITGGNEDKFTYLDQLEKDAHPDTYEAAIAKLSPEERDEYASRA